MIKLKRTIVDFILFLSAVCFSLQLVACSNESADGPHKETTSNTVEYDKEYFISDFLQSGAQDMEARIPYLFGNGDDEYKFWGTAVTVLENEDLLSVKSTLGEVKLEVFYDNDLPVEMYLKLYANPPYSLLIKYSNNNLTHIIINSFFQGELNANLFIRYSYEGDCKCFKALLPDNVKEDLVALAKNMYESQRGENYV